MQLDAHLRSSVSELVIDISPDVDSALPMVLRRSKRRQSIRFSAFAAAAAAVAVFATSGIPEQIDIFGDNDRIAPVAPDTSPPTEEATDEPQLVPEPAYAEGLYGVYRARLKTNNVALPDGLWTLKLTPRGYSSDVSGDAQINRGELVFEASDVLIFRNETPECLNDTGRYRWSLENGELTLTAIGKDSCASRTRELLYTKEPWTKVRDL